MGKEKRMGVILDLGVQKELTRYAALCGQTAVGSCLTRRPRLEQMMKDLFEEAERWDLELEPAS